MRPTKFTKKDIVDWFYKEKILAKKQLVPMCGCLYVTK
jgi:hypothetical protein